MTDTLILCFGDPDVCFGCGEWMHVEQRGGYEDPHGNRFCADWCIETYLDLVARDERWRAQYRCCADCGFDRFEHQLWCPLVWADGPRVGGRYA